MNPSLTVFFLSAGFGKRLQPLTFRVPKPLIPFQGKTALRINHERFRKLKPDRILCNTHHLAEKVRLEADDLGIETIDEKEILGTGGCLANARSILQKSDYFLTHNADLIHDINLEDFVSLGMASGAPAVLGGVHKAGVDTLCLDSDGFLAGIRGFNGYAPPPEAARFTYSGIALYRREFLDFCTKMPEDIKAFWAGALSAGNRVKVLDCSASAWFDFGNPQDLWEAAKWHMQQAGRGQFQFPGAVNKNPLVSNECGYENMHPEQENMVVYEPPGRLLGKEDRNMLIGEDFEWRIVP